MITTDFLVIGSGLAGLRASLELARAGKKVALITKKKMLNGSTQLAQGGISAVDPERVVQGKDSFSLHIQDTLDAADGLANQKVVEEFTRQAYPEVIAYLVKEGVRFTKHESEYELHQEGGHSKPRIYCVADYTGLAIQETLIKNALKEKNITVYEHHSVIDLLTSKKLGLPGQDTCLGAYVYDALGNTVKTFTASGVLIATGGAGRIFLYTSNDSVSTGDGIAVAYRAGAEIANLEFTQFHPTVLYGYDDAGRSFLLTEALRGKKMGAILTLQKDSNEDFVKAYTPDGSAGTRDIVARAIDMEMKHRGLSHVWLNVTPEITGKSPEEIARGFPKIHAKLFSRGIDMTKEPIPVVPASHYTCGGVLVGDHGEVPSIKNLYAIGECSCTGLMGANRLASNSLPEAALYGKLAVEHALAHCKPHTAQLPTWDASRASESRNKDLVEYYWVEIRTLMWHLVGITRDAQRLEMALHRMQQISKEIHEYYWKYHITSDFLELRNLSEVAMLTIQAALWRRESRGGHYRLDYPERDDKHYKKPSVQSKTLTL